MNNIKKILLSLLTVSAVAVVAVAATTAFFSDTETSSGNILQAGAIDLGIDNESFINGLLSEGTTWEISYDLDDCFIGDPQDGIPCLFFNFIDLKPGDYGEDTISVTVKNNDSWVCTTTTITSDDDMDCTEPENDVEGPNCPTDGSEPDLDDTDGDLANEIDIMWWADDGDNVLEEDETVIDGPGNLGSVPLDFPVVRKLSDSTGSIFPTPGPLIGGDTYFIAKAWCFGDLGTAPLSQNGYTGPDEPTNDGQNINGPATPEDGGITCTGASVIDNAAQTDKVMLDVSFDAVQSRNNESFACEELAGPPGPV